MTFGLSKRNIRISPLLLRCSDHHWHLCLCCGSPFDGNQKQRDNTMAGILSLWTVSPNASTPPGSVFRRDYGSKLEGHKKRVPMRAPRDHQVCVCTRARRWSVTTMIRCDDDTVSRLTSVLNNNLDQARRR